MVQANLRLVVRIAATFRNKGLPFDDLVQEGIIGLLRAVMRFDHRMGSRLSSYASWWIRQAIGIALAQKTRIIHVPYNVVLLARRCSLAMDELRRQLGREPTAEEVALHSRLSMDEIKRVAEIPAEPLSLDIPVSDDGEWNLRAPPPGQRENSV
jgi:RNA polymerase primary sigma factor